ncbi:MAG: hypothetical protein AB1775_10785 [Bacteroidota bacterium]
MEQMIQVLNGISPISEEDRKNILRITKTVVLNKGDFWIQSGHVNQNIAFVEEGYLRKYYFHNGKEITDFFYFENEFSADLPSIIGKMKPHANIIAMQKTKLTTFSYFDFNELCMKSLSLEHLHRKIIELTFLRFYKRSVSFILHTPKERYDELITSSPKVFQHAAQYHIASYLGISPQHLSRLRRNKSTRKKQQGNRVW